MTPDDVTKAAEWIVIPEEAYRLKVALLAEPDGGFSIIAVNLPGCGSMGETRDEAKRNLVEAFFGVLDTYEEDGKPVPWENERPYPDGWERFEMNASRALVATTHGGATP